jgi:hypothetical protein
MCIVSKNGTTASLTLESSAARASTTGVEEFDAWPPPPQAEMNSIAAKHQFTSDLAGRFDLDRDMSRVIAVTFDPGAKHISPEVVASELFGPFDYNYRPVVAGDFVETYSEPRIGGLVDPPEVDVINVGAFGLVEIYERKARAGHLVDVKTEGL